MVGAAVIYTLGLSWIDPTNQRLMSGKRTSRYKPSRTGAKTIVGLTRLKIRAK